MAPPSICNGPIQIKIQKKSWLVKGQKEMQRELNHLPEVSESYSWAVSSVGNFNLLKLTHTLVLLKDIKKNNSDNKIKQCVLNIAFITPITKKLGAAP